MYEFDNQKGFFVLHGMMDVLEIDEDLQDKIIKIAKENGVPPEIALAVADMESYGIHHFMPPDSDKVLVGGDGHGIGVMQIDDRSERTHIRCFKPPYDDPICQGPRCKGKTPYDLDCNIEAGIKFLKKNWKF